MTLTAPSGLARKSLGASSLWFFVVGASSPMTVLAGGVIATFAGTGVLGVPLSFLLLATALAFLTVGYVAMSRYVAHAATFYAFLARGLGRIWGVAGALVALIGYNCIQISLYGLLGATLAALLGGPWWVWAALVLTAVAALGLLNIGLNARVLAAALVAEIAVILLLDITSFTHPAAGSISLEPLMPNSLFADGVGGVFALGIAAFVGYESAPVYSEEARGHSAVSRASFGALLFLGLFYAISSWALTVAVGPDKIVDAARSSGLPFSVLEEHYGPAVTWLATILLVTSIFAAMLSFHNSVARYVFALARERVLPPSLGRIGTGSHRGGAPTGGSLVQSAIAAAVVTTFAIAGANPLGTLFTWLSSLAAIAVMLLIVVTSFAVIRFFRNGGGRNEGPWQRIVAPTLGAGAGVLVLGATVVNISSLLGVETGSPLTWILPGIVGLAVVSGLVWGLVLRQSRPEIYRGIGHGRPHPLAVLDHALADVEV
jgi:amino acid transporter